MSNKLDLVKLHDIQPDMEFLIAEGLNDTKQDELRLTFYNKVRQIDSKLIEVELFGCVQFVVDSLDMNPVILGNTLLRPRYNNLDRNRTRKAPMSGAYSSPLVGSRVTLLRLFYRGVRERDPTALAQLPPEIQTPY